MKPFTYLFDFQHVSETGRRWAMHEFAQLGAKHLVLTDTLIAMIMQNPTLQKTLADQNVMIHFDDSLIPAVRTASDSFCDVGHV